MSDVAIRVDGLSKLYHLGAKERYRTLRDSMMDILASPVRRLWGTSGRDTAETLWALQDVTFLHFHLVGR